MKALVDNLIVQVKNLRDEGKTTQAIADILGVSRRFVFREIGKPAPKARPISPPLPMTRGPGSNPSTPVNAAFKEKQREAKTACQGKTVWPSAQFGTAQAVGINPTRYVPFKTKRAAEQTA